MSIEYRYVKDGETIIWLGSRPHYCDRGRWHANRDAPMRVSDADPWPRYYFDLHRGMLELIEYLKIKQERGSTLGRDYSGGNWEKVEYNDREDTETVTPHLEGPTWNVVSKCSPTSTASTAL